MSNVNPHRNSLWWAAAATSVILAPIFMGCSGPPSPIDSGKLGDGQLPAILEQVRANANLPALGAMVVRGGEIVESAVVGLRAKGHAEKATIDDLWHIGSNTKAMTATLAGILVERGLLQWDSTLGETLPNLAGDMRPEYLDATLKEVLGHAAGIVASYDWCNAPSDYGEAAAAILLEAPQNPRGEYAYSNAGYVVAAAVLEEATGKSWEELMEVEIFTPLGMKSAGYGPPGTPGSVDQPWGHRRGLFRWHPRDPGDPHADNPPVINPAGRIHVSLADYVPFIADHLAGARGEDGLVTAATYEVLHTSISEGNYALGWAVLRGDDGSRILAHDGSNTLWYTLLVLTPDKNEALVVVTNGGGGPATKEGVNAALEVLAGRPFEQQPPHNSE